MAYWLRNFVFVATLFGGAIYLWRDLCPNPPEPPKVPNQESFADRASTVDNLNQLFVSDWQSKGLSPAPPATDLLVARRLSLALCGTIPSLEELRQFESLPESDRLPWWTSYLLGQERCQRYLAERLARTLVGVRWEPPAVYRRDMFVTWLKEQIRDHRPYDEMVRELILATGLSNDEPAVNFLTSTCDVVTFQGPDPAKTAGRVAQAFVGVNLECAECHDHPFDIWTQQDFRSLSAFFEQTSVSFNGLRDSPNFGPAERKTPSALFAPELLPKFGRRRERLAEWITARENRAFPRTIVNRVWTFLYGQPLGGTFMELAIEETFPATLEFLVDDFIDHGYSLDRLIWIMSSCRPFRLDSRMDPATADSVTPEQMASFAAYPMNPLRPEQLAAAGLQSGVLVTRDKRLSRFYRIFDAVEFSLFHNQFGDLGAMEFSASSISVPQKLLMMNGTLVDEITRRHPGNTTSSLSMLAEDDREAIELTYLCALTRRPTPAEESHFVARLAGLHDDERHQALSDLHWALFNSSEFAWNH